MDRFLKNSFNNTSEDLSKEIVSRISSDIWNKIQLLTERDIPKVVYTSFDGDLLSFTELLKQAALARGFVPLNPESALGTYLVVNHYKGDKFPIIKSCFALLMRCEHFWVTLPKSPKVNNDFSEFPEGVLAELLYWAKHKDKKFSLLTHQNFQNLNETSFPSDGSEMVRPEHKDGLASLLSIKKEDLPPVVYVAAGERHAKHADWMRQYAYDSGVVPVCPHTLLNAGTLTLAFGEDEVKKITYRMALSLLSDEVWIFTAAPSASLRPKQLETDLLIELYLIKKLQPEKRLFSIPFGDAKVPKYVNREQWAITDYERYLDKD